MFSLMNAKTAVPRSVAENSVTFSGNFKQVGYQDSEAFIPRTANRR